MSNYPLSFDFQHIKILQDELYNILYVTITSENMIEPLYMEIKDLDIPPGQVTNMSIYIDFGLDNLFATEFFGLVVRNYFLCQF